MEKSKLCGAINDSLDNLLAATIYLRDTLKLTVIKKENYGIIYNSKWPFGSKTVPDILQELEQWILEVKTKGGNE